MFRRLHDPAAPTVAITFEGETLDVDPSDTVAAALLVADAGHTRTTPVSGAKRAPFCMMGACFECLVEIDGLPNQQACMTQVRAGMAVRRQDGIRRLEP
jgi:predicted molibdopterin-dependent oxidoreductase YjgC